ncbi:citramalyl-CoA lyase, mitochondrial-like [Dermatophagoides pteronyssinus]|uniref:citramalyl-CoA lyase, mitochondrial-like n=1 Tax=Dermatophagoides pteronyssinus TaxID=6956 RepID=UPI003F66A0A4
MIRSRISFLSTFLMKNFLNRSIIRSQSSSSSSSIDLNSLSQTLLRRAILYVPGNDQRKIDKAIKSFEKIDSIVLDCEDGVAVKSKDDARKTILNILNQYGSNELLWKKLSVRINSMDSGIAYEDLEIIFSGKIIPRTILLPKVDTKTNIDDFIEYFKKSKINERLKHPIDLITYVESAIGLLDLRDIAKHTIDMCKTLNNMHFAGIVFGSDDFCANIGATRSDEGKEVLMARQHVILVCKSLNLQAIDSVYINFRDLDGLKRQSEEGVSMGFTGKQCIHPDQIPIIQEAYRPSDKKIEWAKGLIREFEQAQQDGRGAFVYHGQMIDMPLLKQAYNVINIAKQIGKA